jgi:hypothetical protein
MAALTFGVFRWHLEYFRSPGLQFYRMVLLFVPALTLAAWLYSAVRRTALWKWEPYALSVLIAGACLVYEPRAAAVIAVAFLTFNVIGRVAFRRLKLKLADPLERLTLSFGAGAGLLSVTLVVLGILRLFYAPVFLALLLVPLLLFRRDTQQTVLDVHALFVRWRTSPAIRHPLTGIAIVFGFVAAVCALMLALAPSVAFDPVAMHLPSIQFYAQTHALRIVPGIDYSYYPQGFEMLWTLAYVLAGQPGAQLMSALFFPLFLMLLARLARRCGLDHGATVLAVVCAATLPFLHWSGGAMKNDLALALFELLALYSFLLWLEDRNFRWIVAGAFFLSQAFSVKYVALFGAVPLVLLLGYAIRRQPKPWRAAIIVFAILVVFGTPWLVRAYLLTGNPVAPARLAAATGAVGRNPPTPAQELVNFIQAPWHVLFQGVDTFESPLPNPAGLLFFVFAPLALLGGRIRPKTSAQAACLVFAGVYLLYWSWVLVMVRYAIAAFALLAVLFAAWMKGFYDAREGGLAIKLSLLGAETYCLLIALMGLMIVGINGPQISYFAGRLDKPGYLRAAMQAYGAVEYLDQAHTGHASVLGVEDLARAYAPDPFHFQAMWCPKTIPCASADVVYSTRHYGAEYLILPENGSVLSDVLTQLGNPERVYRDAYFSVYHLPANAHNGAPRQPVLMGEDAAVSCALARLRPSPAPCTRTTIAAASLGSQTPKAIASSCGNRSKNKLNVTTQEDPACHGNHFSRCSQFSPLPSSATGSDKTPQPRLLLAVYLKFAPTRRSRASWMRCTPASAITPWPFSKNTT